MKTSDTSERAPVGERRIIHLNDGWFYLPRPQPGFERADHRLAEAGGLSGEASGWIPVRLPHTNVELPFGNFDEAACQIESSYLLHFRMAPPAAGRRVLLHFEGVMAAARVWLNGRELGEHRGGYTPFCFDITGTLAPDGENRLAVAVDSRERPDIPPFGHVIDYLTYGGIYREAWLEETGACRIDSLRIETTVLDSAGRGRLEAPVLGLEIGVAFGEPPDLPAGGQAGWRIQARLSPASGGPTLSEWEIALPAAAEPVADGRAGEAITLNWSGPMPGAELWDCDHPRLYDLELRLFDGEDRLRDRMGQRIGFRQVCFQASGFRLNGRPLKLRGLNRHQSWPYVGYAMPASAQAADADNLRFHLGCNIVRQSHYPQSRHFLKRCDEIGLLVFAELPGWQHIGDPAWQALACDNLRELILRDRNHPSVILWGVRINESADCEAFYRQTNRIAHELDPSRPTGGVRNFGGSQFLEDVYTYNDFVHNGGNVALEPANRIAGRGRPYLVSEHNGHMHPTKKYDPEPRRIDQALRHARVLEAMYAAPRVSGAIGWCLFDYNTHGDFGSGDHICHHGVQDMFRIDKLAAAVYRSQQDAEPFGEVATSMGPGDHDAANIRDILVFTNSAEVRVFKGERYLGTFRPDRRAWPHLPHPPIRVDDLIGDAVETEEHLPPGQARTVKRFLLAFRRRGGIPLLQSIPMLCLMLRKGWRYTEVYNLYGRHISGWGSKSKQYRFEGWTGDRLDWVQERGPAHADRLDISVDRTVIAEGASWECCRVEVHLRDNLGNTLPYSHKPVRLELSGPLEIIGPETRSLGGGSTAFWLRTTGKPGKATIRAVCERFSSSQLEVLVQDGSVQENKAVL